MIIEKFLTNNYTYKSPYKIKPRHIIVHSTAVGYKSKDVLFNSWNKYDALSVHGMVDDVSSYKTLPFDILGYHVGKKGNTKTIGFEICEPKNIAYANANHTKIDTVKYNPKDSANIADFNKRWNNAVEMAVSMCKETGLSADKVISHKEGYAKGIASNHGDPEHWFSIFGKTMDDFRADVKKELNKSTTTNTQTSATVKKFYRVQCGAFTVRKNADNLVDKLQKLGFSTFIVKEGLFYKVQCGAFSNKNNAQNLVNKLQSFGISAIIKFY